MEDLIKDLKGKLPLLKSGDAAFAANLIASYHIYGSLTAKQLPCIQKLIDRADNPTSQQVSISVGPFQKVIALFKTAQEHLKFPKITLQCQGKPILLSVAGKTAKAPGSINVMGEGKYPNREWYGRVSQDGDWSPSKNAASDENFMKELHTLLVEFGNDPAGVAKKYGKLTGNCCFCNSELTDVRSTAAGFGPVCAEHYGLKEQWKVAAGLEVDTKKFVVESIQSALQSIATDLLGLKKPVQMEMCFVCEENPAQNFVGGQRVCHNCEMQLQESV